MEFGYTSFAVAWTRHSMLLTQKSSVWTISQTAFGHYYLSREKAGSPVEWTPTIATTKPHSLSTTTRITPGKMATIW